MVRIVVYSQSLRQAGGRSVAVNLMRSLPEAGPGHEWLFVVPHGDGRSVPAAPNAQVSEAPRLGRWRRMVWELAGAPGVARRFQADWVVALGNVPMRRGARNRAVLLHDPHLFYPIADLGHLARRVRLRKRLVRLVLRSRLRRQRAIFVQTEVAAERVQRTYGVDSRRLTVVPNAVSALANASGEKHEPALGLPDAGFTVLVLTKYAGRKGLERVVAMFERYGDLLPGVRVIFTIDASKAGGARELMKRVSQARLGDRILNIGPVRQEHLPELYGAADLVLHPSLLESYSGVYAEAMAFGVPIVTSDRDFARVVCGDAAVYVDPHSTRSMARAVAGLAAEPERRAELVERGRARLAHLNTSWRASARTMVSAMERGDE